MQVALSEAPISAEYVPASQPAQLLSPVLLANDPAPHDEQELAPGPSENVPVGQKLHDSVSDDFCP